MYIKLTIILALTTLIACNYYKSPQYLTKLDQYANSADSLSSSPNLFDSISSELFICESKVRKGDIKINGRTRSIRFIYGTKSIEHFPDSSCYLTLIEYPSNRNAATAFRENIFSKTIKISGQDSAKLLNLENIKTRGQLASITIVFENLIFDFTPSKSKLNNNVINYTIDKILNGKQYLRLDLRNDGDVIWVKK